METERGAGEVAEKISIAELRELLERGEEIVVIDSRTDRSYNADPGNLAGAIRIPPEDPVRAATEKRLSQHATLVVYCA
jgi:rhodanese-related sulfurtransferase